MRKSEMRKIALAAIRSEIKHKHIDLATLDANAALRMLDDLYRVEPELIASLWYGEASDNQISLFRQEWNRHRLNDLTTIQVVRNMETGKLHIDDGNGRPLCGSSLPRFLNDGGKYDIDTILGHWGCKKCIAQWLKK